MDKIFAAQQQARDTIFTKLTQANVSAKAPAEHDRQPSLQPDWDATLDDSVSARFTNQAIRSGCSLALCQGWSEATAAIQDFITNYSAADDTATLVADPTLATHLQLEQLSVSAQFGSATEKTLIGVTSCFCAIADTGSVAIDSSVPCSLVNSLLPSVHIALVERQRILPFMEDALARYRQQLTKNSSTLHFISGPSRTGDIEQTIVIGAHGPVQVHLVIVD